MENIIENHIEKVKKKLRRYNILILKSKYDKEVSDKLIQAYIDARYYNSGVNPKIKIFYKRIYMVLEEKAKEINDENPEKEENIKNILMLFQYYFYLDNVRKAEDINNIINAIAEFRVVKLKLKSAISDNFIKEFTKELKKDLFDSEEFESKYKSNDFGLTIKKVNPRYNNYYRVSLNYNFKFPEIFSQNIIDDVFNFDIISEDKLFVEYPMVTSKVLLEILEGEFNKVYICDFAVDLLKKPKKLEQILEILESPIAQEKIFFNIKYNKFIENKKDIFKLITRGFSFALETTNDMPNLSISQLKILEAFNLIIVDKDDVNKEKYTNIKILEK